MTPKTAAHPPFAVLFREVHKEYDRGWIALHEVSFEIPWGAFVFLVGPTGAGKSTALKLMFFREHPTEGEVITLGLSSRQAKKRQIAFLRRRIGMIFQDFKLLNDRDVRANILFSLEIQGYPRSEALRRTNRVLLRLGLMGRATAYPYELSGGERQKVAIARALVKDPDLFLADEPTGNIDPEATEEIMDELVRINQQGTTVVMATHDMRLLDLVPQKRMIVLRRGRVVEIA